MSYQISHGRGLDGQNFTVPWWVNRQVFADAVLAGTGTPEGVAAFHADEKIRFGWARPRPPVKLPSPIRHGQ